MLRGSILSIFLSVIVSLSFAQQGTVAGKIVTSDSQPAKAISVLLKGTKLGTITDESGYFSLKAPVGSYALIVQASNSEEVSVPIIISGDIVTTVATIQLTQTAKQLPEVVVTGQYGAQSLKNSVYKVRSIGRELIQMRNATDLTGVLNNELGIRFSTDYALGETDIYVMGMSGQNVKILLDGVPLVDRGSIRQSLSQVDINSIEKVEIVEGPMSVMYGTDALAGVINIITKKNAAKQKNTYNIGARIQEETAGSEYNPFQKKGLHNQNIHAGWTHKSGINAGAGVTRNNFGGWQGTKTGRQKDWRPKDQFFANGTVGYRNQKFNTWYRFDLLDETIWSEGTVVSNMATDQEFITRRLTHTVQADWLLNEKLSFNSSFSYQDYQRRTRTTDLDVLTGKRTLNTRVEGGQDISEFSTIFFRGTAQYKMSPIVSFQPGIEIKSDQTNGPRIKNAPTITDYSLFASAEIKPVSFINIRPGARFSKNSVYDAPPVIPSLNTKIALNKKTDLRLSYGRGFRAPALRELYFDFHDANHSINGNPDLKAEYSNSFTGSLTVQAVEKQQLKFNTSLSGFYNHFKNRIDIARNVDPANPNEYYYINVYQYKTTGGTLENSLYWKKLQLTLGLSYIGRYNDYFEDATYDSNKSLPQFVWSPEVNSNILYQIDKAGVKLGLFYKYTGKMPQYQVVTTGNGQQSVVLGTVAGFHTADFTVSKSIRRYVTINTGAKNIFNVKRINNTIQDTGGAHSSGGDVLKSYGTSFFLGLAFNWNK
ncbi:MAG: TonB-dependent receptor [Chitinophagaceae bacterium]|nr:TonB-dependent receptor [Chitinophagaceae bacterium]MCW5925878.1 TonB-dependent receptor [Chitinophagaceae bacterium]